MFIIILMRKPTLLFLLLLFLLYGTSAVVFPGYDFTFAETDPSSEPVEDDDTIIAFDYTGYGYLGKNMRTGLYLRLALEAPLSSILSIFGTEDNDSDEIERYLEQSFDFQFSIGPSFRKFIGDDAIWYMGTGATVELDYLGHSTDSSRTKRNSMSLDIGAEADMGIRISISKNTTMRLGARARFNLVTLNIETEQPADGRSSAVSSIELIPNMFLPENSREKMEAYGYISLGHTFRSDYSRGVYSYIITTPERFSGTTIEH